MLAHWSYVFLSLGPRDGPSPLYPAIVLIAPGASVLEECGGILLVLKIITLQFVCRYSIYMTLSMSFVMIFKCCNMLICNTPKNCLVVSHIFFWYGAIRYKVGSPPDKPEGKRSRRLSDNYQSSDETDLHKANEGVITYTEQCYSCEFVSHNWFIILPKYISMLLFQECGLRKSIRLTQRSMPIRSSEYVRTKWK